LCLKGGRVVAVDRAEGFACNPAGTEMFVYAGDELISFIDMMTADIIEANP
jgi:hypothetical protein